MITERMMQNLIHRAFVARRSRARRSSWGWRWPWQDILLTAERRETRSRSGKSPLSTLIDHVAGDDAGSPDLEGIRGCGSATVKFRRWRRLGECRR